MDRYSKVEGRTGKECGNALFITAVACNLFDCMDTESVSLLAADLVQLADTLAAMLVRAEVCGRPMKTEEESLRACTKEQPEK